MPVRLRTAVAVLVLGLGAGVLGVATSGWLTGAPRPSGPPTASGGLVAGAPATSNVALAVLRSWDDRRAAAWAAGDADGLARLYTAGSAAGAADVALLRRYTARGLVVRAMRMQLLRVQVLTSRPRVLVLEITDRLASAVAYAASTDARTLPRDAATTHRLVLRRVGGVWRMARVSTVDR